MGKNRKPSAKNSNLGRTLIKENNATRRDAGKGSRKKESWLHTSEVQDGYDWNRLNLQSVTEQNTLDDFLETAELAGVEFTAEKLNIRIVGLGAATGVLGDADKIRIKKLQDENKQFITIPRRPIWDDSTSPEELALKERDAFLNWRRGLALLSERQELLLTPYEKNLDVWRQLWRVIERSDMVCQIVDGRNPLLYKCDDLEKYVKEVNKLKDFIVLINKADYLTEKQRSYWAKYFTDQKTKVIFWSALEESEPKETTSDVSEVDLAKQLTDILDLSAEPFAEDGTDGHEEKEEDDDCEKEGEKKIEHSNNNDKMCSCPVDIVSKYTNTTELIPRCLLLQYFKTFQKTDENRNHKTIGLVGYPNVGKSSTINALLQEKKTAVSATPGKTKHFQTHFIDDDLCLCDCPGLVFPTFISTKAEMVLNGILPIDQMRDHTAPSTALAQLIPRKIIENTYGINIAKPKEGEDPNRAPTAEEVLSSYASMRGYMTSSGLPDCPRASRYILKDFIKGKLLYCHSPPGVSDEDFMPCHMSEKVLERLKTREMKELKKGPQPVQMSAVDKDFFAEKEVTTFYKLPFGVQPPVSADGNQYVVHKPWKKHHNKNKKEKLRRICDMKNTK